MHIEKCKNSGTMRIGLKDYKAGNIKLAENINKNKGILVESKKILDRAKKDGYEYKIDGLIYLPANLPVKGEYNNIIPKNIISDNLEKIDFKGSLFDLLAQNGHIVSHSESTLRPTMLTKRDFPEMKDSIGLFLLLEEIFYDISGVPVCYSNDYYSSNVFDFKIIRKRQLG